MTNPVNTPRLLEAAKEFNIGTHTIVEYLRDKGFDISSNPSTKLSPQMYLELKNGIFTNEIQNIFSDVMFDKIPDPIELEVISRIKDAKLTNAEILDLSGLELSHIPKEVWGCYNIKALNLSHNNIKDGDIVNNLPKLESLNISNNKLTKIYLILRNNKNLNSLYLDDNMINEVKFKGDYSNLKRLSISNNRLSNLDFISKFRNLERLNVSNNQLSNATVLKGFKKLQLINVSSNHITTLDFIDENSINIKSLIINNNNIVTVNNLSHLKNLQIIDISYNDVNDIKSLLYLPNLRNVYIDGNPVCEGIPLEVLAAGWSAIRDRLLTKELVLLKEAKVLFLGNPNVGKSDLLYYLRNNTPPVEHKSTHGLVYEYLDDIVEGSKIHCWDFGGQEYYHATHQLFFSPGALHLLLWSKNDIHRNIELPEKCFELGYWLRCIEQLSYGEGNSVESIIIENKIDKHDFVVSYLDTIALKNKYDNLRLHFTGISIEHNKRMAGLIELIKERLNTLFQKHPRDYIRYQERIHECTSPVLSISDISESENTLYVQTAMKVLHNIGCVLYFHDVIPDKVFVKPQILLDFLYNKILNQNGEYKIEISKSIISDNELGLTTIEIESLLKHFNLVFQIPSEPDYFYVPQYLGPAPILINFWENYHFQKAFIRVVSDSFLMQNAMLNIYAKYASYVKIDGKTPLFWKDGLLIEKDSELLLLKFNRSNQWIELYTDTSNENLFFQMEIVKYILSLGSKTNLSNSITEKVYIDENIPEYVLEQNIKNSSELVIHPWESNLFDVQISVDGCFFINWKELVEKRKNGIYNVIAKDINGKAKTYSVFDFNMYLPKEERGKMKKLFISYSKLDLKYVNKFRDHLTALKLDGKLGSWYCTELTAGSGWNTEIQEHFDNADLVCFMISPNFMKTQYIHEYEIEKAFAKKHKNPNFLIVPIIIDFCRWTTIHNNLGQFTALPYMAKPILDFPNQNKAWYIIEHALRIILDKNVQPTGDDLFKGPDLPGDIRKIYEELAEKVI